MRESPQHPSFTRKGSNENGPLPLHQSFDHRHPGRGDGMSIEAQDRYRDRVGTRVLTGDLIDTFARFTAKVAEKKTPCFNEPDLFFEPGSVADAKKACHKCPMMDACLNFALDGRQLDGVWGGLSEAERARILKARRAIKQKQWKREREARALAAMQPEALFEMSA